MNLIAQRIEEIRAAHGCSLRYLARNVLFVDPGYLSRLRSGEKNAPSASLLRRLGLRAVVTYERIAP